MCKFIIAQLALSIFIVEPVPVEITKYYQLTTKLTAHLKEKVCELVSSILSRNATGATDIELFPLEGVGDA